MLVIKMMERRIKILFFTLIPLMFLHTLNDLVGFRSYSDSIMSNYHASIDLLLYHVGGNPRGGMPLVAPPMQLDDMKKVHRPDHGHTTPDVLVLCTPWGGLTNVKQRLLDCLQESTNIHPNKDVRFLTPWLMARPIVGPFVPLDQVFKKDHWMSWLHINGYHTFLNPSLDWHNVIPQNVSGKPIDYYYNHLQDWAKRENVTLMREIGRLIPIDSSFGTDAFVLRDDLIPKYDSSVLEESCCVHARIEADWLKYSKGNPAIYTSFDEIRTSLNTSQICKNRNPTILTADIQTVKSQCGSNCIIFNNTDMEYYIQASALDFHRAVRAETFIGNIKSSFTCLTVLSRNFSDTYTYSQISGKKSCIRQIHHPDSICETCVQLQCTAIPMKVQMNCTTV